MHSAKHGEPFAFATAQRSRALLARFIEHAAPDDTSHAVWSELADSLATLERSANDARASTTDWMAKAALARAEERPDLADVADRRAALAEQEFAEYLGEIAAIWDFLENGARQPLPMPTSAAALDRPSPPTR